MYKNGLSVIKLTAQEATQIQNGQFDVKEKDEKGVLDKTYWHELYGLTEKF